MNTSDHARQRFRPPGASWNQEGAFYGDAFSENVMVHESKYSALIDWGWSGWHLLEHEFAMLASGAFESGLARHAPQLDLPLLGAIRLNIGLEVASYGLIDWSIVRQGLREALEYGS